MLRKILSKGALCAAVLGMFGFAGCNNLVNETPSDGDGRYGYISVKTGAKYIDTSTNSINKAYVTVTGYNMTQIGPVDVTISAGSGSGTIENIPVGKRVIAAQAYKDSSIVPGKKVYAVKDIVAGDNGTIILNDSTSIEGKAYYYLAANNVDISNISSITGISSVTDHNLFDADAFAKAYASNSSVSAASYVLKAGSVTFTASNASGYTVWVADPNSEKCSVTSDGTYTVTGVAPGTWGVYVNDGTSTTLKGSVTVSGDGSTVASGITVGDPLSGKTVIFISASSAPNLWAWETSGNKVALTEKLGFDWYSQPTMSAATSDYMNDPSGWYMLDVSSVASGGAISFIINSGSTITSSKTTTFWYDNAGTCGTAGTYYDTDPTTAAVPSLSAKYSSGTVTLTSSVDVTSASVTVSCGSNSTTVTSFTSKTATVDVSSWGLADGAIITASGTINGTSVSATCSATSFSGVKIYVSASSAPTIWAWTSSVKNITNASGYPGETMAAATDLNYNKGWYVITTTLDNTNTDAISIILNGNGTNISTGKSSTFWYDVEGVSGTAGTYYDSDPTTKPAPVAPTLTISPASGKEVGTSSSIKITAGFGNDTPTVATVTINGTTKTLSEGTNSFAVSDYATTAGVTINVSATVTNSVSTATVSAAYTTKVTAEDPFTWDNVNAYFVLTDRFYNGDSTNDHSYSRQNGSSSSVIGTGYENCATFHGGDLAGLTAKLDYFDKLGVNAIWFTAPYEQIHGWVSGKNQAFPHYAFHGYYTLDWSSMDQNMGTVEELRTFVNACHSKGIRVIMDVVMNHVGYNNTQDMVDFNYGYTEHTSGWLEKVDGVWNANDTVLWDNSYWDATWFGPWVRSFGYDSGSLYGGDCGSLPDVKTELTSTVGIAPVLLTKWNTHDSASYKASYYNPSVADADWNGYSGDYRQDRGLAPADYQVIYLSAWVREVGIDGFRCDTAKHVEPERWGQLKVACEAALEAWRNDSTKSKLYNGVDTGAADWDEGFWMTGECYTYYNLQGGKSDSTYFGTGKFDSMINFSFNDQNKWENSSYTYNVPTITSSTWSSYLTINSNNDTDGNGNRDSALSYVSSHDTRLSRWSDQAALGTMFELLPGGVQIYYGDESYREKVYTDCGDGDMATRGDMNWSDISGTRASLVAHWGKVGNFRKYNPAVGAGTGSATLRTYSGAAGDSKVAINISSTSTDVSSLWSDGTTVYNWYDGTSATVSGGSVTFSGGSQDQPILISDKNPASYGITF